MALNILDAAAAAATGRREAGQGPSVQRSLIEQVVQRRSLVRQAGEEHFNLISALHKSMRNSDPNASVYWLARMLEAGEDPLYIARRLVRFASEDIGNADPVALSLAVAAKDATHSSGCRKRIRRWRRLSTANLGNLLLGIRLALGASARSVKLLVFGEGMAPVVAGLGLGLAGALALTRYMEGLLFGVTATDPATFATVSVLLVSIAALRAICPRDAG